MDNVSESNSNISLDSLENDFKRNFTKQRPSDENVDTILIPLYEKDVLIKIPKRKKKENQNDDKYHKINHKCKQEINEVTNYLVNKNLERIKKKSYLEMFRKQFTTNYTETHVKRVSNDVRSISPEFGDTERESIGNESNKSVSEFYNTEAYNEIYYNRIMKREIEQYLEQSFEDVLHLNEDEIKLADDLNDNNLKSISEVSLPRRRVKKKVSPIQNVALGGLGPDMERIKPRLERARSLQRYSERVRMENRLKIYRKEVQDEKNEKEATAIRHEPIKKQNKQISKNNCSYLVNKNVQEKSSLMKKIYNTKSKSADVQRRRERDKHVMDKNVTKNNSEKPIIKSNEKVTKPKKEIDQDKTKLVPAQDTREIDDKSSTKIIGLNVETMEDKGTSPLHISFTVNVGGVRPSTALKSLEEKHRMYQEKVKQYTDINKV